MGMQKNSLEEKFNRLVNDYSQRFEEAPYFELWHSYGMKRAVEILEGAKGRKIEIQYSPDRLDWFAWRYEGEEKWHEG